jgi:hypothetical protein
MNKCKNKFICTYIIYKAREKVREYKTTKLFSFKLQVSFNCDLLPRLEAILRELYISDNLGTEGIELIDIIL